MTSKITTKRGDAGDTSLLFGRRVRKTHPRVRANGSLDEFNVALGYVRASLEPSHAYVPMIRFIQERLFGLMGQITVEADETERYRKAGFACLQAEDLERVDQWVKEHGARGMGHGARGMEQGAWSMEHGARGKGHGVWGVLLNLDLVELGFDF